MTHFSPNALIAAVLASAHSDTSLTDTPVLSASLDRYPDRDLGIGYGRSSGYADKSRRSYGEREAVTILRVG